ncbi:zinc finger domain-containing protein relative of woc isoform X3 [Amblyomma americanum]
MPSCSVPGCDGSTASSYHPFPRKGEDDLRARWFTATGLAEDDIGDDDELHVCSRHFRPFDFVEKGVVRKGAVPSMRLTSKTAPAPTQTSPPKKRKKSASRELDHLEASNVIVDEDSLQSSSRPSRRAARVAALKISDTVRKYNLAVTAAEGSDSDEDFDLDAEVRAEGGSLARLPVSPTNLIPKMAPPPPAKQPAKVVVRYILEQNSSSTPLPLVLECEDEPLTPVQRESHVRAVNAYNRSVRRISEVKAKGAKLIYCCPKDSYSTSSATAPLKAAGTALLNLVYDPRTGMLLSPGNAPVVINAATVKGIPGTMAATPSSSPVISTTPFQIGQPRSTKSPATGSPVARQVPLITGGSTAVTASSLLMVKVMPSKVLPSKVLQEETQQLDAQYRRVVDGQNPVPWLAQRGVLQTDMPCKFCRNGRALLQPDSSAINGYSLRCRQASCQRKSLLLQPSFFARFGLPLWKLICLVYHWARQSELDTVLSEAGSDSFMVRNVWRGLQEVCARAVATRRAKLGGPGIHVEVATAQMGRYLVLGALDRSSLETRLKAVSVSLGWNSPVFLKSLELWLRPGTVVVTEDAKFSRLNEQGFPVRIGVRPGPDLVHSYLLRRLTDVFGHFMVNQLKLETVQGFLDELQWRERFANHAREAFWRILADVLDHSGWKVSFEDMLGHGPQVPGIKVPKAVPEIILCDSSSDDEKGAGSDNDGNTNNITESEEGNGQARAGEAVEEPVERGEKTSAQNCVILDEYYYARKKPCPDESHLVETKGDYGFKCPVCKKIISDNIRTVKHITSHIEGSRQRNPDLTDLTICKYCFKEFETPYSMQCHTEAAHLKPDGIVCRICSQEFDLVSSLIDHMKLYHNPSEMPYSCQLCGFRSSFHSDVISHFHQDHLGTNALLCRFCLRVYIVKFSNNCASIAMQNFYSHLFKHLSRTSARRCPICCLVFLSPLDMKVHREREHVSMLNEPGVEAIKTTDASPILVPEPHMKPRKATLNNAAPAVNYLSNSSCRPRFSMPAVHLELQALHCCCLECRKPIDEDHFNRSVSCGECRYTTNCTKAFADHMICRHSAVKNRTSLFRLAPPTLRRPGTCPCGFQSHNGNNLISHLVACDEPTASVTACGPTTRTMRLKCLTGNAANYFPPLINLDDEDTNLNEPFSEVFSSSVSNELPATAHSIPIDASTSSANDAADEESQGPNILNLLGLMRKPSHSSFNDAEADESSGQAAAVSPERCFVGPKSAKRRWAAMGMILDEGSDSEPPVLEPQNSRHRRPARHCLEEAPSLEAQVELANEGDESKLPVQEEEYLTNSVREECTAEAKPTGSNGSEDCVWPALGSCVVLDS